MYLSEGKTTEVSIGTYGTGTSKSGRTLWYDENETTPNNMLKY
jgi:hypothetical protein